jgi:hypothetical protein
VPCRRRAAGPARRPRRTRRCTGTWKTERQMQVKREQASQGQETVMAHCSFAAVPGRKADASQREQAGQVKSTNIGLLQGDLKGVADASPRKKQPSMPA